jgi:hypothetical protein
MGDISDLEKSITKAIAERRDELCLSGRRGLERELPEKVGQVLYNYYGNGWGCIRSAGRWGMTVHRYVRSYVGTLTTWISGASWEGT